MFLGVFEVCFVLFLRTTYFRRGVNRTYQKSQEIEDLPKTCFS